VVTWIVLTAVLVGLLVLALAARPLLGRRRRVERALRRLRERQRQAEALQADAARLQAATAVVQQRALEARQRIELIKAKTRAE
jgi:hypothetical protein